MARKPGNLNPDSTAGNARLGTGRGSNAGRSQPIPKGSVPKPKKFGPPAGGAKPKPYLTRAERKAKYERVSSPIARKQIGKYAPVDTMYDRFMSGFQGPLKKPR